MSDGRGGGATPGALHIVSTPIGNLADLSPRAVAVLREVQLVLAEDSRVARVLLSSIEINTETTSLPGFDEADRIAPIIARLLAGDAVALISDAGTPLITRQGSASFLSLAHPRSSQPWSHLALLAPVGTLKASSRAVVRIVDVRSARSQRISVRA